MSVIATFELPAREFVLGPVLTANPGVRVRLERLVPVDDDFVPYFWTTHDAVDDIEAALREAGRVETFEVVDAVDDEVLVRVRWTGSVDGVVTSVRESGGTILQAVAEHDTWRLRVRFDDHDDLTDFYRACTDRHVSLDIRTVHNPGQQEPVGVDAHLTDAQRETLRTAYEEGYFDVPRSINMVELASLLGVSDTATSQRVRRGISTILEATLADADDGGAGTGTEIGTGAGDADGAAEPGADESG